MNESAISNEGVNGHARLATANNEDAESDEEKEGGDGDGVAEAGLPGGTRKPQPY